MNLNELQNLIKEKYFDIDSRSGPLFLLAVLFEEVGELAEAVRQGKKDEIKEELADVMFMVISLANLFDIRIEGRVLEKYIQGDPSKDWDLIL